VPPEDGNLFTYGVENILTNDLVHLSDFDLRKNAGYTKHKMLLSLTVNTNYHRFTASTTG
jgi:hypothetical protein